MGYVDCDTHVIETAKTWDYIDPGEERLRPMINGSRWNVEDLEMGGPRPWAEVAGRVFAGTDLVDIKGRLKHMDDFGVDLQVLFPTWWLLYRWPVPLRRPPCTAAITGGWPRARPTAAVASVGRARPGAPHGPRLRGPRVRQGERCRLGVPSGPDPRASLADPTMFPLFAKAQDLDLTVTVHVGGDLRNSRRQPGNALHANMMTTPGAFFALLWRG